MFTKFIIYITFTDLGQPLPVMTSYILKPCAKKKHFQLKFTVSGVLPVMMFVKAGKSGIKEMTSLQRIHASISERWLGDVNVCFGSTGRSK
jgi:hypothetical protein